MAPEGGAAAARVSRWLMSLPGAGDSSLTGGSCALVAVLSCWAKELQEEGSSLCGSKEEEQDMAGSSQRLCRAKDHPSPVLQRRENLETTLTGAVDADSCRRQGWKPLASSHTKGLLFHLQLCHCIQGSACQDPRETAPQGKGAQECCLISKTQPPPNINTLLLCAEGQPR